MSHLKYWSIWLRLSLSVDLTTATLCLLAFRGQQSLRYSECRMPQLASFWACHHVTMSARHLWNCTGCQYVIASSSNWHYWCTTSLQHTSVTSHCQLAVICRAVATFCRHYRLHCSYRTRTKFGETAFCVSGPTIWNSLPESLRSTTCTATFKRHLKSHF